MAAEDDSGGYPNLADGSSQLSMRLAWELASYFTHQSIRPSEISLNTDEELASVTSGYLEQALGRLAHLRPGEWNFLHPNPSIATFIPYEHLTEIAASVEDSIVITRSSVIDDDLNQRGILEGETEPNARLTPLRATNNPRGTPILHAVISCKWTLRNDRAQNVRTEVLNLVRHRKGHLPHIVAVTAEPMPSRIAALALGTGDLDCVYHFALNELREVVERSDYEDAREMLNMMIDGKRLRDISDLPFDLAA